MNIIHIANHELRRMFKSPIAWVILAVVQFLLAIFFFILLKHFMDSSALLAGRGLTEIVVAGLLQIAGTVILMVTPFITMRLFSEERGTGTIQLLFSSPVTITELVLGKYLGTLYFLLIMLALIALMPFSLYLGTQLDFGHLCSGLLGLFLLMASFAAIGMFVSTLTNQVSVAAITTFGVLIVLWILNLAANTGSEITMAFISYLSLLNHYNNLLNGIFSSIDIIYYLLVTTVFVVLSIWRLDGDRLHQ